MDWASKFPAKPSLSMRQSHHTLMFYSSIGQWQYSDEVKAASHLDSKYENNFEVVQCTLLDNLISLGLLSFENLWRVVIMLWTLFFRTIGKEEGEAAGRHCDNSSFISMLVCLFAFLFWFPFFCLLACSFSISSPFKEQLLHGWNILLHYLFVFALVCLFNVICCTTVFLFLPPSPPLSSVYAHNQMH